MSLEEFANIGEILGAAGVIASLILVGWQIRTNTRVTRLKMYEQYAQSWWAVRRTAFVPAFRDYLETSSKPEMKSLSEYFN